MVERFDYYNLRFHISLANFVLGGLDRLLSKKCFRMGAVQLMNLRDNMEFKVNGQRLKHYYEP